MNSSAKLWGNCPMLGEMYMKNNLFSLYISDFKTKCAGQEPSGSTLVSFLCSWHSFLLVSLPLASPPSSSPSIVRALVFLKFLSNPVYSLSILLQNPVAFTIKSDSQHDSQPTYCTHLSASFAVSPMLTPGSSHAHLPAESGSLLSPCLCTHTSLYSVLPDRFLSAFKIQLSSEARAS